MPVAPLIGGPAPSEPRKGRNLVGIRVLDGCRWEEGPRKTLAKHKVLAGRGNSGLSWKRQGAPGEAGNRLGMAFGKHVSSERRCTPTKKPIWTSRATHHLFLA
jgi:hypothetical protein